MYLFKNSFITDVNAEIRVYIPIRTIKTAIFKILDAHNLTFLKKTVFNIKARNKKTSKPRKINISLWKIWEKDHGH